MADRPVDAGDGIAGDGAVDGVPTSGVVVTDPVVEAVSVA